MKRANIDKHISAAKGRLVHLHGLVAKTDETERRILASAEQRLTAVSGDLDRLRPRVHLDQDAAGRYQNLTLERGQLELVIAKAREVLGS